MEEKIKKRFNIEHDLDWESKNPTLDEIRKDLDILESLGATNLDIEASSIYDIGVISMEANTERFETDEEFRNRLAMREGLLRDQKRAAQLTIERLKEKFNLK